MSGQSKIKFAVIGQGHIGKRHAEMIRRNSDSELVAVCDIRSKEACGVNDIKEKFYTSVEELIFNEKQIDVICICTPNGLHASMAIQCMKYGSDVVIEKPMSTSVHDAEKILETSIREGRNVFCVMQNRYSPPSIWLKELIDKKITGEIYMVQVNCFWNRDERYYTKDTWHGSFDLDGGTLFTQFSHFIDMIYWLFGDIKNISGTFNDFNHQGLTAFEDSGMIQFDFINGGMGCLNYSTSVYNRNLESSLTIIAEKGTIKVAGQYMNEVKYCDIKNYKMPVLPPSNPPNDYGSYKGSAQNHHFVIKNVVDKLKSNQPITTNMLDGFKVVDIIERIYKIRNNIWSK